MMVRLSHQAKLHSYRTSIKYQFGVRVLCNHEEAMELDRQNGNKKWRDAEQKEIDEVQSLDTFKDLGVNAAAPKGYKKIRVHIVYAVKHDGQHKGQLVAGEHLTDVQLESVYSGIISLRSAHLIAFIAELNDLELYATDISNAYLESFTSEKVYIIAGAKFGNLEGHTLLMVKAHYGFTVDIRVAYVGTNVVPAY